MIDQLRPEVAKSMKVEPSDAGAKVQWMSAEEFKESGLLWHVNQSVLWPLGLALAVTVDRDVEPPVWEANLRVMKRVPFEAIWSGATEDETREHAERLEAWMRARIAE